jgi:hypothetical protein
VRALTIAILIVLTFGSGVALTATYPLEPLSAAEIQATVPVRT